MLFLFRTNQIVFNLFLLLYLVILRASSFWNPVTSKVANEGALSVFFRNAIGNNPLVEGGIVIVVLFLQAVLLNNLAMRHRLFNESTLLPGLFYLLMTSMLQDFFPLSAILFGNLFLIIALDALLSTYKRPNCAGAIFNTGFWVGVASLFYSSFVFFLLLILIGLGLLRNFSLKERLMLLSGFLVPSLFMSTWFFVQDGLTGYWQTYFAEQFSFMNFQYDQSQAFLIKLFLLLVFFLLGFFNGYSFNKAVQTRNVVKIIYLTLFVSGLTFLFQPSVTILHFLIIMVPLSLLVTARFLAFSPSVAEFIHTVLLLTILFFQYRGFDALL